MNSQRLLKNVSALFMVMFTALFITACNEKKTAEPKTEPAKTVESGLDGEKLYQKSCFACHNAGVSGAPKLDDKADWAPRIAKGMDSLYSSAINGYTGSKGMMPAKGGNSTLTDAEVKQIVDYMLSFSKK